MRVEKTDLKLLQEATQLDARSTQVLWDENEDESEDQNDDVGEAGTEQVAESGDSDAQLAERAAGWARVPASSGPGGFGRGRCHSEPTLKQYSPPLWTANTNADDAQYIHPLLQLQ